MESVTTAALPIGTEEIRQAAETLARYKRERTNLEERLVQDEKWWRLRHWDVIRQGQARGPEPASAWLFNAILNKHADAMDNYPEPVVLPREPGDRKSAELLSAVLPTVLEYNCFAETYARNWWEKLKHGTAAYGIFWDNRKYNGRGDIAIRSLDLLKLFWEPGITDLQDSANLFLVEMEDREKLLRRWPQLRNQKTGLSVEIRRAQGEDTVDESHKVMVVDWYYKVFDGNKTILHYCKFTGDTVLYASENDPAMENGWYEHGNYPVVLDVLFPEKDTPAGFGYVALCKDPQLYIDKLFGNLLEYSMKASKPRAWVSTSANINEEEYLDWSKPLVHVEGELDERRVRSMTMPTLSSVYVDIARLKIDEMKDTAANRDVNAGSTPTGVTAAAAIAALQESGNKVSRDMIQSSYSAYGKLCDLCIRLMRQFYDEKRAFRIAGPGGEMVFSTFSSEDIRGQREENTQGAVAVCEPIFDVKLTAQKKNPFSRMEQNQRAMELFTAGFFDASRASAALAALDMMEFEGIEQVKMQIRKAAESPQQEGNPQMPAESGSYTEKLARRTVRKL